MELHLFIDPHTQEITEERCRKCKACKNLLPYFRFYPAVREKVTARCQRCYDAYYMEKADRDAKLPVEINIERAVQRAHRRSRFRRVEGNH